MSDYNRLKADAEMVFSSLAEWDCQLSARALECLAIASLDGRVSRADYHGSVHALIRRGLMAWGDHSRRFAVPTSNGIKLAAYAFVALREGKVAK